MLVLLSGVGKALADHLLPFVIILCCVPFNAGGCFTGKSFCVWRERTCFSRADHRQHMCRSIGVCFRSLMPGNAVTVRPRGVCSVVKPVFGLRDPSPEYQRTRKRCQHETAQANRRFSPFLHGITRRMKAHAGRSSMAGPAFPFLFVVDNV